MKDTPKPRADGQKTGLAGEFFVAAELLKRGLQTSLTLGNAKSIDLFAINDKGTQFSIQVKALRSRNNYFPLDPTRIESACVYVFVILNKPGIAAEFYVVPGADLHSEPGKFGKWFLGYQKFPGVHAKELAAYRDGWQIFEA